MGIVHYLPDNTDYFKYVVQHEVVGHGFGKLGDEYADMGASSTMPDSYKEIIRSYHDNHWYSNVDVISDPDQISWHHFLELPEYTNSGEGIFEGAEHYAIGAWRPSFDSMMRNGETYFNAPSREAIYKRIHSIAYGEEWQYDFNAFLEWDKKNLQNTTKTAVCAPYSIGKEPSAGKLDKCVIVIE